MFLQEFIKSLNCFLTCVIRYYIAEETSFYDTLRKIKKKKLKYVIRFIKNLPFENVCQLLI